MKSNLRNTVLFLFSTLMLTAGCADPEVSPEQPQAQPTDTAGVDKIDAIEIPPVDLRENHEYPRFSRAAAAKRIRTKITSGEPLTVHIMVPLCDNEHQGIVPVSPRLGNGLDLKDNLYWGARYGIKTHFKKLPEWTQVSNQPFPDSTVLERVVFQRTYANGTDVYLVADAYRGDSMRTCVYDILGAAAGAVKGKLAVNGQTLGLYGNADLLIFNGHNGILDFIPDYVYSEDERVRDVAVIGCVSYRYFEKYLLRAKGYPILTTSNLMAPEAYVAAGIIDGWASGQTGPDLRTAAGRAYNQYQKCGLRGATNLFYTGWQDIERYGEW